MNVRFHLIVGLAFAAICAPAPGMQYQRLGLVDNIEAADRIVIGKLESEGGGKLLRVTEILKGENVDVIHDNFQHIGDGGVEPEVLYMESHLAKVMIGDMFQRRAYIARFSHEWNIVHMLKDPAPFLDQSKYLPDVDRIAMLGYLFEAYDIQCPEIPGLFRVWRSEHQKILPWDFKDTVECKFHVKHEDHMDPMLIVDESGEQSEAWRNASRHVREALKHWETFQGLPEYITVRVSGRRVPKVGSLTHQAARDFLLAQIRSEDLEIAKAAVMALARMHDLDSVPTVIELLNDGREELVVAAVNFLGWSRDRRAVQPLRDLLGRAVSDLPRTESLCGRAAQALQWIGDPSAVPELILALQSGVDYGGYVLGAWGSAETIDQILATERKTLPRSAGLAMFSLVRRSNIPREQWPIDSDETLTKPTLNAPQVEAWRQWWSLHRDGFKIVMDTAGFEAMLARDREEAAVKWRIEEARRKGMIGRLAGSPRGIMLVGILISLTIIFLMIRRGKISLKKG
jgi:hypothetical protein